MITKQIFFTKPYMAELLDTEYSSPIGNQVTVELEYTAVSAGTEKANYIGMRNAPDVDECSEPIFPRAMGYSGAGIVIDIGADVKDISVGDRVLVYNGKHKKHITTDRKYVMQIPDEISTMEASMIYISIFPLSAIRKTKIEIGESALVMGLGILGMFAVQELVAAGAYPVIAVDPIKERREMALGLGADYAFDPNDESFLHDVKKASDGGVNVCIEVTGLGIGLIQALDCMNKMGRIALLGCTRNSKFEIDYYGKVHGRGISLIGAHTMARPIIESSAGYWTDEDDLKTIMNLTKGKRLNFKDMICEIHSPANAQNVYSRLVSDSTFPVGVLFDWNEIH